MDQQFRSTGAKKTLKEEALESLKAMTPVDRNAPPSALQALLGGLSAGVIALILYKFTTTIEASLNRQTISDNFSVRQITITIRTIINGICYLATFVFGINAVGLVLYSGQLGFNSIMGESSSDINLNNDETQVSSTDSETNISDGDQDSNNKQQ
ncbi:nuclear pore complex protein like protein [Tanacetum coccineum]